MKLGIFKGFDHYHKFYIKSCEELKINYELIDITAPDWLDQVSNSDCDGFLCRPPCKFQERKTMFDERLYIINKIMKKPIYPSYDELYIYENKRMMFYWLKLNGFPHTETHVFYRKKDFYSFLDKNKNYPLVFKSNIGSTAKGVKIVKTKKQAKRIAHKVFGLINPKLARGYTAITTGRIIPITSYGSREKHFLLVQKFEKIKWEWRIVKIDESYFGHKKLLKGNFASSSDLKGWKKPPDELLYLVKKICELGNFYSMNVDIFETEDGRFLVNELQSLFGQKTEHLMYVNNSPGRYIYKNNKFIFEEGSFTQHQSYLLRIKHFLKILQTQINKDNHNEN